MQVECNDSTHVWFTGIAIIAVFSFPIGVPTMLFLLLFMNRAELRKETSKRHDYFSPVIKDYRPDLWWWEAVEMLRRVTFTGLIIFFDRGSIYQLAVGIQLSAVFTTAAVYFRPFRSRFNNNLYCVANGAVLVTFNIGILLSERIDIAREPGWIQSPSYLDFALFLANVFAPAATVAWEAFLQSKELMEANTPASIRRKKAKESAAEMAEDTVSDEFLTQLEMATFENPL